MFCCFSQTSYVEDWFLNECEQCLFLSDKKVLLPDNELNAWHNARVAFFKDDYKQANYYLLKDNLGKEEEKTLLKGHIMLGLGVYNKAMSYFKHKSLLNNKSYELILQKSLIDGFYANKQYDSVAFYCKKILQTNKVSVKLENEVRELLAYINLLHKDFKGAEFSFQKLLSNYKINNDSIAIARVYSSLGNLFFEQYKDNKAKQYFDSAYIKSRFLKNLKLKRDIVYNLYIVSEALKKHKKAVSYLKEYNVLKDSIQTEKTIWEVAQHKEAINLAKKQAEVNKKTAERNILFIVFVSALLLLITIYFFYKKLQKQHFKIKRLNEELATANKLKNQVFSIVAHDLRSPVALLKQKFNLSAKGIDANTVAIDKGVMSLIDSLNFLLDNLLNWSLSQSNLLNVQKDWFPLYPVMQQIKYQYESLINEKEIKLTIDNIESVLLFGDMELFKIAIRNCLDNAVKFTPKGGSIRITGEAEKTFFKLKIQDSGVGIPETILKTLFELNVKKAQKDTTGRKSSGLGLHLVKSMVTLNDGEISIKNNPKGGTIVNILVPYKIIA
ncbi:tetratricopeptide repeat-containing sensor histidine kinase [Tenacibaculum sp. M341]|uniref:tetratricopeptide repeat-containing sensor histidine kinase n=1 Tax=Tenacibaculum sp. M341 TaxID=2530339 RepID=UPI001052850B|nr:ATP-binding protein [Tenacibaculum sp. M341]TCI93569.1 hypothetical protein EYW44_03940 [Tenacibaculum sp. M341]